MNINTITIKQEYMLEEFEAWSGGKDVINAILEHEKKDEILEFLGTILNEYEDLTETQVNDFLWFDAVDVIADCLDIALFD